MESKADMEVREFRRLGKLACGLGRWSESVRRYSERSGRKKLSLKRDPGVDYSGEKGT